MAEKRVPLLIRIPPDLKTELTQLAKMQHRSLNQQIEFFLTQALADVTRGGSETAQSKREAKRNR